MENIEFLSSENLDGFKNNLKIFLSDYSLDDALDYRDYLNQFNNIADIPQELLDNNSPNNDDYKLKLEEFLKENSQRCLNYNYMQERVEKIITHINKLDYLTINEKLSLKDRLNQKKRIL